MGSGLTCFPGSTVWIWIRNRERILYHGTTISHTSSLLSCTYLVFVLWSLPKEFLQKVYFDIGLGTNAGGYCQWRSTHYTCIQMRGEGKAGREERQMHGEKKQQEWRVKIPHEPFIKVHGTLSCSWHMGVDRVQERMGRNRCQGSQD